MFDLNEFKQSSFDEEKFKFDFENIQKDFAIENIDITDDSTLRKFSKGEITKQDIINEVRL